MTISFNSTPTGTLTPFMSVEINNSNAGAGPAVKPYRALLIGQKTSAGTASAPSLQKVFSANQVAALAGRGSLLHRQALAWYADNKSTELWIGVLADDGSGVAASGTVSFAGPATAAGTLRLYVGGTPVSVGVASGDTAAQIATNVAAALPSASDLPLTGAVDGSVTTKVDLTARNKGTCGNEIDVRFDYQDGETLPAGVTPTVVAMASGATNPSLTSLITAMGDTQFDFVAHPYTDSTDLGALEVEFLSRFGPMRMIDGALIAAKSDTLSNLVTFGNTRNSAQSSVIGLVGSPTPAFEVSANVAGIVAVAGAADPARPFQTLASSWIKAPAQSDRLKQTDRNTLLSNGIATLVANDAGQVQIERMVTTYQKNGNSAPDTSYRDLNTMLTLSYLRYSWQNTLKTKYPRHKLADDGAQIPPGQAIVTPRMLKAEAVHWFGQMIDLGLVEDLAGFKDALLVQRNSDPNRVDFMLAPNIINGFIVGASALNFVL